MYGKQFHQAMLKLEFPTSQLHGFGEIFQCLQSLVIGMA